MIITITIIINAIDVIVDDDDADIITHSMDIIDS